MMRAMHLGEPLRAALLMLLLAGALGVGLGGCNTMEGLGEDVEAAGETVSGTADDVEDEM